MKMASDMTPFSLKKMIKRAISYTLLILLIFIPLLAWETDRNMVRQLVYPVIGQIAAWSTQCSEPIPTWLKRATKEMATHFDSPANQVAYIRANGAPSQCVNGWQDLILLSPRLQADTPMRLASLSKLVSFVALTQNPLVDDAWLHTPVVDLLELHPPFSDARLPDITVSHLLNHSAGFDRMKQEDPMVIRNVQPWCPYSVDKLKDQTLQFTPGERHAYANLGYCLAAQAYEKRFGKSLWDTLEQDLNWEQYGFAFLKDRDSPVAYNFMNQSFYGPDFPRYFDWNALKAPMGMTGNAKGLAEFAHNHLEQLNFSQNIESFAECDDKKPLQCFNGFWERRKLETGETLWLQGGYLYGMSAIIIMDKKNNLLVWLGSGDKKPSSASRSYWLELMAKNAQ